jgi:acyl-CoA reductase-like NAD-dependent aldehyde dehydrogenase
MPLNNDKPQRLLIGGEWIETKNTFFVNSPYSGERVATVCLGGEAELETAVVAAQKAFTVTRRQSANQRAELLLKIARGIEAHQSSFVEAMVAEAGKPVTLAEAEVRRTVMTFTAAAEEARREHGELLAMDAFSPGQGHFGFARRFPLGLIYGITPFNFPLNLVAHKVAPCIATGNVMVVKPATKTPLCALLLGKILTEAGATPGQVNFVTLPGALADRLVIDDRVKSVSFTGSPSVGWTLKAKCGKKRITLELGGNAGVIVHHDANLDLAIPAIAKGGFAYAGQSCISVQRVLIHESIYDEAKKRLVDYTQKNIHVGDPQKRETVVGPMIDRGSLERIAGWIQAAIEGGAKCLIGGKIEGNCLQPTILDSVQPKMNICAQEAFAPIVTLHPYREFEDAIAMVNDSTFGLQAGVYTRDITLAWKSFAELEVGGILVNQVPTFRVENMPYGGVKDSGFGREGLRYAMEEMTELKSLILKVE